MSRRSVTVVRLRPDFSKSCKGHQNDKSQRKVKIDKIRLSADCNLTNRWPQLTLRIYWVSLVHLWLVRCPGLACWIALIVDFSHRLNEFRLFDYPGRSCPGLIQIWGLVDGAMSWGCQNSNSVESPARWRVGWVDRAALMAHAAIMETVHSSYAELGIWRGRCRMGGPPRRLPNGQRGSARIR